MNKKMLFLAALVLPIAIVSGCIADSQINSFEDCINAGYPALESYPRQCNTPDGKHFVEEIEEPIGGDRDENGCLGPAGYTWNEDVSACVREWELDEEQKSTATTAVDYVGWKYATTIIQVEPGDCEGCLKVLLEQGEDRDMITVLVDNGNAVSKTITRHTCTEEEKQAEICTMEYAPVCGFKIDGTSQTYGNKCGACSDDVDYWEIGECAE
ncbi:MAG: hypothetical protein V1818_02380 [Candidatus Aenigmatarchaeota archaeon]